MQKKLLFALFFSTITAINAQFQEKKKGVLHLEKHQVKLNLLNPGFNYEFAIGRNQTVSTGFNLFSLALPPAGYSLSPAWTSKYNYYYNLNSRKRNGKNVGGNSGDYFGTLYSIFIPELEILGDIDDTNFGLRFVGAVYGVQRTYPKGFNFSIEGGAGYYDGRGTESGFGPTFNFSVGWVLGKKKKQKRKEKIEYINPR
ncbi:hypothetical protein [Spongiimicrobium salis]|uniref:hypothetical protein n=1 Tax=Spongiimicrobium salis TaxID=1667022 RepID=UPI00374CFB7A